MKSSRSGGFEQAYNAQVAVDQDSLFIVACSLSNHPNDKAEAEPTLAALPPELGTPAAAALDNGFWSEQNRTALEERQIEPYIATGRERHHQSWQERFAASPNHRRRTPVRKSRWPTSCAPRSARPSIVCANAPSNRSSASSKPCWASASSHCGALTQPTANGAWSVWPST